MRDRLPVLAPISGRHLPGASFSRLIRARSVLHQDMQTVLRCHIAAFEAIDGIPHEILYDRMKTVVIGEAGGGIACNRALIDFARHYGFQPKACRPYRANTKGKVERPYRYIREDFFLARSFRNLDDMNVQLRHWLDTVANPRVHATTQCVVNEAFAAEKPHLGALPLASFRAVLKLERRVSHEAMVSVGGNLYSVPDATWRRIVEVHTLANEVQIFEDGTLIANHPVLDGRRQRRIAPGHRKMPRFTGCQRRAESPQKWRRKIPQPGGMAIRPSIRRLRFSVVGPGVSASAEWGSRWSAFCGGLPRRRDRRVRVGDSSSLRFG